MNPKQLIIITTMAFAITFSGSVWSDEATASPVSKNNACKTKPSNASITSTIYAQNQDQFHAALGTSSDEDVYNALYSGQSLAEIATNNYADVQDVIDLQVAELSAQLDSRLESGSLSPQAYLAHKSELAELVTRSAYGEKHA